MKLSKRLKYGRWDKTGYYKGRANGNHFEICECLTNGYYVLARHKPTNRVYNSLWDNLAFPTIESAIQYCEEYQWKEKSISQKELAK